MKSVILFIIHIVSTIISLSAPAAYSFKIKLLSRIPPYFFSDVSNMSFSTTQEVLHSNRILLHISKSSVFLYQCTWITQH